MSNYRRLISYIYAYEGGVKGKNIGYAKIEVRGDQCRIQVSVKKVYVGSSEIGVYLLSPGAEIMLGRIFIRNGAGEFRIQVKPENVEGSGCSIDECYGLTIHDVDSTWQSYTTIWEDAVAQTAEIQLADVTAENVRKKDEAQLPPEAAGTGTKSPEATDMLAKAMAVTGTLQMECSLENSLERPRGDMPQPALEHPLDHPLDEKALLGETLSREELDRILPVSSEIERELEKEQVQLEATVPWEEAEEQPELNIQPTPGTRLESVVQPNPDIQPQSGRQPTPGIRPESGIQLQSDIRSESGVQLTPDTQPQPDMKPIPDAQPISDAQPTSDVQPESDTRSSHDTQASSDTRAEIPIRQAQPESPAIPEPENLAKLQELDRLEKEIAARNNLWDRLQRSYTKVLAFDYDNGCEILSIKPQDIGLLPREIWVYGNNSFLLHGYYNYRHLILARLNNPQGASRYLLGVPGHYFSNEKYMASMFGFPHFVLAKKQPEDDGRFGYWYTDIRL